MDRMGGNYVRTGRAPGKTIDRWPVVLFSRWLWGRVFGGSTGIEQTACFGVVALAVYCYNVFTHFLRFSLVF